MPSLGQQAQSLKRELLGGGSPLYGMRFQIPRLCFCWDCRCQGSELIFCWCRSKASVRFSASGKFSQTPQAARYGSDLKANFLLIIGKLCTRALCQDPGHSAQIQSPRHFSMKEQAADLGPTPLSHTPWATTGLLPANSNLLSLWGPWTWVQNLARLHVYHRGLHDMRVPSSRARLHSHGDHDGTVTATTQASIRVAVSMSCRSEGHGSFIGNSSRTTRSLLEGFLCPS